MGLKKGEKIRKLARIEVVSVRREQLSSITADDVIAEGFPNMTPTEFVAMFCRHMRADPGHIVTRIEFVYLEPEQCCRRDHDRDGNCDRHEAPGRSRRVA